MRSSAVLWPEFCGVPLGFSGALRGAAPVHLRVLSLYCRVLLCCITLLWLGLLLSCGFSAVSQSSVPVLLDELQRLLLHALK